MDLMRGPAFHPLTHSLTEQPLHSLPPPPPPVMGYLSHSCDLPPPPPAGSAPPPLLRQHSRIQALSVQPFLNFGPTTRALVPQMAVDNTFHRDSLRISPNTYRKEASSLLEPTAYTARPTVFSFGGRSEGRRRGTGRKPSFEVQQEAGFGFSGSKDRDESDSSTSPPTGSCLVSGITAGTTWLNWGESKPSFAVQPQSGVCFSGSVEAREEFPVTLEPPSAMEHGIPSLFGYSRKTRRSKGISFKAGPAQGEPAPDGGVPQPVFRSEILSHSRRHSAIRRYDQSAESLPVHRPFE